MSASVPSVATWVGATTLQEQPESPSYVFEARATQIRTYKGKFSDCLAARLAKGVLGVADQLGWWVLKSEVTRDRGDVGKLVITWEGIAAEVTGGQVPPEEFGIEPFEINPHIEKHPLFAGVVPPFMVDLIRKGVNGDNAALAEVKSQANPVDLKLLEKMQAGRDSFYLAGLRYAWSSFTWTIPALTAGGFIDTPAGPLASAMPTSFAYLRQSDQLAFQNGLYKTTRTWLGAPLGHWDSDLYT